MKLAITPGEVPRLDLTPERIDLWVTRLENAQAIAGEFFSLLSEDERERAGRIVTTERRSRFIVTRGLLRMLHAAYAGGDARDIVFSYGEHGKPAAPPLHFNHSDSGDLAVFAFAKEVEVGIDIERLRPIPGAVALAKRFFAEQEARVIAAAPSAERAEWFFSCWTRKEAVVKCLGEAVAPFLRQFEVNVDPAVEPRVLTGVDAVTLRAFSPAAGYFGAIASRGDDLSLQLGEITLG